MRLLQVAITGRNMFDPNMPLCSYRNPLQLPSIIYYDLAQQHNSLRGRSLIFRKVFVQMQYTQCLIIYRNSTTFRSTIHAWKNKSKPRLLPTSWWNQLWAKICCCGQWGWVASISLSHCMSFRVCVGLYSWLCESSCILYVRRSYLTWSLWYNALGCCSIYTDRFLYKEPRKFRKTGSNIILVWFFNWFTEATHEIMRAISISQGLKWCRRDRLSIDIFGVGDSITDDVS